MDNYHLSWGQHQAWTRGSWTRLLHDSRLADITLLSQVHLVLQVSASFPALFLLLHPIPVTLGPAASEGPQSSAGSQLQAAGEVGGGAQLLPGTLPQVLHIVHVLDIVPPQTATAAGSSW